LKEIIHKTSMVWLFCLSSIFPWSNQHNCLEAPRALHRPWYIKVCLITLS
jgi:hypothetical protein